MLSTNSYSTLYQIDVGPTITSTQGRIYADETFTATATTVTASDLFWNSVHQINGKLTLMPGGVGISIADCYLLLIAAAFTAAPWIPRRFSLRSLLIATTLIALVLGAIVYAAR